MEKPKVVFLMSGNASFTRKLLIAVMYSLFVSGPTSARFRAIALNEARRLAAPVLVSFAAWDGAHRK